MTIAVVLKIGDGIVMGADSAATLSGGTHVANVYFNAEKLFNLVKGWPVGTVTYGLGGLDGRSIYNLAKELRERLGGDHADWATDKTSYTVAEIAQKLRSFFYGEYYLKDYPAGSLDDGKYPTMGFMIAGYSAEATQPEVWGVTIDANGNCDSPQERAGPTTESAIFAEGQSEAAARVLRGWSPTVLRGLTDAGVPQEEALKFLQGLAYERLIHSAMPLQDGIDLVRYVVDIQIGFVRFTPGAPTVSKPVDLAAITKHEGFRWIDRKHWYSRDLNVPPSDLQLEG